MRFANYITTFFACLFFLCGHTQKVGFTNISAQIKLPALECYSVNQDSKGYIWIATEYGMCKYNGSDVEIFNEKNGLPEGAVYAFLELSDGTIIMATSKSRIVKLLNDSLVDMPFSEAYSSLFQAYTSNVPYKLTQIQDELYINSNNSVVRVNLHTNKIVELKVESNERSFLFDEIGNGLMSIDNRYKSIFNPIPLLIRYKNKSKVFLAPYDKTVAPYFHTFTIRIGEIDYVALENILINVQPNLDYSLERFPNRIISLYKDKQDGIWVGVLNSGVYYYPNAKNLSICKHNLEKYSVSGVYEDSEKNVWCTTLEKGVFLSRNKNITVYPNVPGLQGTVSLLKNEQGRIFASAFDNKLMEIKHSDEVITYPIKHKRLTSFSDIAYHKNQWYGGSRQILLVISKDLRRLEEMPIMQNYSYGADYINFTKNGKLIAINYDSYIEEANGSLKFKNYYFKSAGTSITSIGNDSFYVSTRKGLLVMKYPSSGDPIKVDGINASVTKTIKASNGLIWVATKGGGLFVLKNGDAISVSEKMHIPTNLFFDIAEDKSGTIWIASNIGLIKIMHAPNGYVKYIYSELNGLPSNDTYKVAVDKEYVYVSTSEGLCSFPLSEELTNTQVPPIYMHALLVNGKAVDLKKTTFHFPYNSNSLHFTFDAISFKGLRSQLLYRFKNIANDSLKKGVDNEIFLENLSPDEYDLEVFAVNSDGVKSTSPVMFHFVIKQPFWQTIWFVFLCVLLLFAITYYIFILSVKRVEKREAEKTHFNNLVAQSKLAALQAQMNPHFIFNAINSIQNYILKKKEQDAYDYLSKFSKLIRMVLNNSKQPAIPLKQELDTLKLYIELEQLRFKDTFDFKLHVHDDVDTYETYVPVMIIQPYVENAIWHGLMNLGNKRRAILSIDISIYYQRLKIVVEDNGVGRKRSEEYKSGSYHSPMATTLTEERLAIINTMQGFESTHISTIDLYDENEPSGTKIEIWIPIINL